MQISSLRHVLNKCMQTRRVVAYPLKRVGSIRQPVGLNPAAAGQKV